MAVDICTCITPSAKIMALFASDFESVDLSEQLKSRPLLGIELLRLQGMSLGSVPNVSALNNFGGREMAILAGNAFSSAQASVAFVMGLQLLGKYLPCSKAELKQLRSQLKMKHIADKGVSSRFAKRVQVVLYVCVCVCVCAVCVCVCVCVCVLIACLHLILACILRIVVFISE